MKDLTKNEFTRRKFLDVFFTEPHEQKIKNEMLKALEAQGSADELIASMTNLAKASFIQVAFGWKETEDPGLFRAFHSVYLETPDDELKNAILRLNVQKDMRDEEIMLNLKTGGENDQR